MEQNEMFRVGANENGVGDTEPLGRIRIGFQGDGLVLPFIAQLAISLPCPLGGFADTLKD